ncbi:hypothetical protein [Pseudomarimonas arenosa]|uniref:Uncharacterized protein n=1 Tax=Pseudomarimonas arenosa TaxID=2774145 RepID=A0AAW3ZM29_9GAMM|nr:hypothetical protein [Pseudomarimonas arenosa]MBD8526224.1 hypothetical protein [Pseudomarimonas arenosa]
MDAFLIALMRLVAQVAGLMGAWSIRLGEHLRTSQQRHRTASSPSGARSAPGVPAATIPRLDERPMAPQQVCRGTRAQEINPNESAPRKRPLDGVVQPSLLNSQSDELDWAGSLSHAAVASSHLGSVVEMIHAGWLVSDESRVLEVAAELEAIQAFQERTDIALAPFLQAMTEQQQVDFFGDFQADFPPDFPDLNETQ